MIKYKVTVRREPNEFVTFFMRDVREGETKESLANYLFAKNGDVVFNIENARYGEAQQYVRRLANLGED